MFSAGLTFVKKRQIGRFSEKCFRLQFKCLLNWMVGIIGKSPTTSVFYLEKQSFSCTSTMLCLWLEKALEERVILVNFGMNTILEPEEQLPSLQSILVPIADLNHAFTWSSNQESFLIRSQTFPNFLCIYLIAICIL